MKTIMKRSISLFMALVMLVSCLAVSGVSVFAKEAKYKEKKVDGITYGYLVEGKKATITSAYFKSKKDVKLTFPSKLGDAKVTAIDCNIYECNDKIKSITIPDSVEKIGNVISASTSLEEFTIGKNVKKIDTNSTMIGVCPKLKKITIKSGNKSFKLKNGILYNSKETEIIKYLPSNKETKFVVQKKIKSIGGAAFAGAKNLKTVEFKNSMEILPSNIFNGCKSLSTVSLPKNLKDLGSYTFQNSGIKKFVAPKTVTSLGYSSFNDCSKLSSFDISKTKIKSVWFGSDLSSLQTIKLPSKLESLSIYNLSKLSDIKLPSSLKNLEASDLKAMKSLKLPSKLKYLRLSSMTNLKSVSYPSSLKSLSFYKMNWSSVELPSSLESLDIGDMNNIKKLDLSKTKLKSIDISYCKALSTLKTPSTLKTLYLYKTPSVKSLDLTKTKLTTVYLAICKGLETLKLPSSLKRIPYCAFADNAKLSSVTIPSGVTEIEGNAFANCKSLKSIKIPNTVSSIGDSVFENCTALKEVKLPNNDTNYGYFIFSGCKNLKSLTIPEKTTYFSMYALNGSSVKTLNVPGMNTYIDFGAHDINKLITPEGSVAESCYNDYYGIY